MFATEMHASCFAQIQVIDGIITHNDLHIRVNQYLIKF